MHITDLLILQALVQDQVENPGAFHFVPGTYKLSEEVWVILVPKPGPQMFQVQAYPSKFSPFLHHSRMILLVHTVPLSTTHF